MTRTALVTGTSSGIGLAVAGQLHAASWHVVGLSRTRGSLPPGVGWLRCDLGDPASVERALSTFLEEGQGGVDAIVHAAGLQYSGHLGELDQDGGARMWAVHVRAAELLVNRLAGSLSHSGRIVLIGSRTMTGVAGKSQYAATKAALSALARSWAAELAPRGVTVNVVAPGPTRTPMLDDPNRVATPPRMPPLGRLIEPREVADLTCYLLGDAGAMITGQTLVICGGASLA